MRWKGLPGRRQVAPAQQLAERGSYSISRRIVARRKIACKRSATVRGGSPSLLVRDVLGFALALGRGHFLELLLAHRRRHRLRCAFELALGRVATLGGQ